MIVFDSGPIYAAADANDKHHVECADLFRRTVSEVLVLPIPVINEVCWWLQHRGGGPRPEARFLSRLGAAGFLLTVPEPEDYQRAAQLLVQYADFDNGKGIGYVDALVVATAERFKATRVATVDHRHFSAVRPAHAPAFELLP